jgi:hypothetical protein
VQYLEKLRDLARDIRGGDKLLSTAKADEEGETGTPDIPGAKNTLVTMASSLPYAPPKKTLYIK